MIRTFSCLSFLLLISCTDQSWNNPYPSFPADENAHYGAFTERPKHLDPARSYSSDEWRIIAQVYEPPLQYHFLHEPLQLVPLAAASMPEREYLDASGQVLPASTPSAAVAYTRYRVEIMPGVRYQPHPAFVRAADDRYLYHGDGAHSLPEARALADFPEQGSRERVAEDYVYQIKRLAYPSLHSPLAPLLSRHIVGFAEFAGQWAVSGVPAPADWQRLREMPLEGVRVLTPHRYEIVIKGVYPQFIYWLATPFFAPMPWEADAFHAQPGRVERNLVLDWFPVGTGPFMLTENNPNLRMVLERNPNFHGERYPHTGSERARAAGLLRDAGQPLPFLDRAVYSLEPETIPSWTKFLQGYYDVSGIASDGFDQAIQVGGDGAPSLSDEMRARGIRLTTAVPPTIYYMGFNMRDPVIGGGTERARLLRQAIAIVIDYEELISIFRNGRGQVAHGPVPPGLFGHDPDAVNPVTHVVHQGQAQRRPLSDAQDLLNRAGYPGGTADGKPLVLYYDTPASGPDARTSNNWFIKQFKRLGIQLVVRATDYNRFRAKMRDGNAQIFQWGWHADYPDPENFLFLLYGPNGRIDHGGENTANYHNEEYDRLFEGMRVLENGPERRLLIDRMVDLVRHDTPWLFGFHPTDYALSHEWFHNAKRHPTANNTLKYRRVDPRLRLDRREQWNQPLWRWPLLVASLLLAALIAYGVRLWYRRQEEAPA